MDNLSHTELELGYRFHIRQPFDAPGYSSLGIVLHEKPSGHHFDPERVSITVVSHSGQGHSVETAVLHHGWHGASHYHVCAGRILLLDRKGKSVEAFTYGGGLDVYPADDYTTLTVASSAPILDLTYEESTSIAHFLAAESEALLAQRRAYWLQHDGSTYEQRLATVDPFVLYASIIQALNSRIEAYAAREGEYVKQFAHFVAKEAHRLDNQSTTGPAQSLDEVL